MKPNMNFFMPFNGVNEHKNKINTQQLLCKILLLKQNVKEDALKGKFKKRPMNELNILELQALYQAYLNVFQERKNAKN
jgi:hypothetical protein